MSQPQAAPLAEAVEFEGRLFAYIIRAAAEPKKTSFVTQNDATMQAGFVVYPGGSQIPRHVHKPLERHIVGTPEALFLRKGACRVDFYSEDQRPLGSREFRQGDFLLLLGGGHGFAVHEDTIFLEVKQGPYTGTSEKVLF